MRIVEGVLLDLDGVLVDSWPVAERAIRAAVSSVCGATREPPVEEFRAHLGKPLEDIARALDLPGEFVPAFRSYARKHAGLVRIFDGIPDMLRQLRAMSLGIGVVTAKDRLRTEELFEMLDLSALVDVLVTADDAPGKPDPAALNLCMEGLKTRNVLGYLGDAVADMIAARNAGVPRLLALWSDCPIIECDVSFCTPAQFTAYAVSAIQRSAS
ncbi:MAG TPA: HAD-IA family hydrolase [Rhizomicrobium sp.]|nr:HAD-IA family hydrolase [Rhizomicrobium sp.]